MKLSLTTGLVAGLLALGATPALAVPVTVDLRIEGATRTLFDGPVTTDVRPFNFTGGEPHECDGDIATPQVTAGAVIAAAPVTIAGTWNDGFGSPTFSNVAGETVSFDPVSGRYLAEFHNGVASEVGSCLEEVAPGSRVLFGYARFGAKPLALSGPATARTGHTVSLKVTDAGTGAAVAGARVGDRVSGSNGMVTVGPWTEAGTRDLKAELDGWVRSNRVRVSVSATQSDAPVTVVPLPGAAAVPDRTPPTATLLSRSTRELRGRFAADPSGIRAVKLRLTWRQGGVCRYFSGRMERFRRTRCGTGAYFQIGDRVEWSYLLPARLERGRYVLDAIAIDGAGNRTPLERGRTRVVFRVR